MVLGFAFEWFQLKKLEGIAQMKSTLVHGRAEPCLTTAGRAELWNLDL